MVEFTPIREDLYQRRLLDGNQDRDAHSANVIIPPPPVPTIMNVIDAKVHRISNPLKNTSDSPI